MLKKILLPLIFILLAYGFWLSEDFKGITAGIAIFMFGMLSMERGFSAFTGGILEQLVNRCTSSTSRSLGLGLLATSVMQSSSLVSVVTISFLSAGLLTLTAGIGIIFGANLGTTTGAWLIAGFGLKVNISAYAMPMLVFGIILVFQKSKHLKGIGYILAGLGFLFLGIHYMREGFETFKETIDLSQFAMSGHQGLLLFAGIGVFATVVMQSSHATLVLIITALAAQQITYENGLALAIGANIGTTITAILGAISSNARGRRLAAAHLIFNLFTGLIAIIFIQQLIQSVETISRVTGIPQDDHTLKLALFHTLFNLAGVLIMSPLISPLARLLEHLIKESKPEIDRPKFLTGSAIHFPETALKAVLQESLHVYDNAQGILLHTLGFRHHEVRSGRDLMDIAKAQKKLTRLDVDAAYQRSIKSLYSEIVAFISRADFSWQMEQSADLHHLREANQHVVEAIKDLKHLQKNLVPCVTSGSPALRQAYDQLRVHLAGLIHQLEQIRLAELPNTGILSLDSLKLTAKENHEHTYLTVIEMIGNRRLSPEQGTSLMNDNNYCYSIAKNLLRAAEALFVSGPRDLTQAARSIALSDNELQAISEETAAPNNDFPPETEATR